MRDTYLWMDSDHTPTSISNLRLLDHFGASVAMILSIFSSPALISGLMVARAKNPASKHQRQFHFYLSLCKVNFENSRIFDNYLYSPKYFIY
ncbi:hypothetical protein YC2023_082695 [Brassica napus]